jgi:hypothetical protein
MCDITEGRDITKGDWTAKLKLMSFRGEVGNILTGSNG